MNIGQLPPFFIWPYALFYILTRKSLFFMLEILSSEQEKYYHYYDSVKESLERTTERTFDFYENSFQGDGYGVIDFLKSTVLLFFGAIFLMVLKMYILFRHLNYVVFVILFYWSKLLFNQNERNAREQHRDFHEED